MGARHRIQSRQEVVDVRLLVFSALPALPHQSSHRLPYLVGLFCQTVRSDAVKFANDKDAWPRVWLSISHITLSCVGSFHAVTFRGSLVLFDMKERNPLTTRRAGDWCRRHHSVWLISTTVCVFPSSIRDWNWCESCSITTFAILCFYSDNKV